MVSGSAHLFSFFSGILEVGQAVVVVVVFVVAGLVDAKYHELKLKTTIQINIMNIAKL